LGLLEAILLPLFRALPKNEHGKLGHSTVRYALHRLFILRHGWNIRGLQSQGATWNSSSPAGVLKGQVPSFVQDLFEQRLGGQGLGLHELAVLAATIEHLVHDETVGKLGVVFDVLELSPTSVLSDKQADEVLDTYMMGLILGKNLTSLNLRQIKMLTSKMHEIFTGWTGAKQFVDRIRGNITVHDSRSDFATLVKVVEVIGEEYGSFQNIECQELKSTLMKIEDRGTGRVRLADFYKPALDGAWQFQESQGYLRQIGALDESNPRSISVIIPNYLHSQTNCIASSGFYSVCCKDECEDLMGHLEGRLASSEAKPKTIAAIVASLASPTTAPRKLSATLLRAVSKMSMVGLFLFMGDCLLSGCTTPSQGSVHTRTFQARQVSKLLTNGSQKMVAPPKPPRRKCLNSQLPKLRMLSQTKRNSRLKTFSVGQQKKNSLSSDLRPSSTTIAQSKHR
jgi:hypothetical protein